MTYFTVDDAKDHFDLRSRKAIMQHSDAHIEPDAIRAVLDYIYNLERRVDKLEEEIYGLKEQLYIREDSREIPLQ